MSEEQKTKLEQAWAAKRERDRAWREKVGPHWKAVNGECCVCGKSLSAYESKFINVKDGRIFCLEHDPQPDFYRWSDG